MFWISIWKDILLIFKEKMFWIVEGAFVFIACIIAVMMNLQTNGISISNSVFQLSFPLTMAYATMTFIPIGDYHREQRNGSFLYLMSTGLSIKKYAISKGIVLSIMIYLPSFAFLLVSTDFDILLKVVHVILIYFCALNMSLWYTYEIIYSTNPMKTMGKASMLAMGLFLLLSISVRIKTSYFNYDMVILILGMLNIISLISFVIKLNNLHIETIVCRR